MGYNRSWKSFPEQLELLKSRGMVVTDKAAALNYLQRVGNFRLSAQQSRHPLQAVPAAGHYTHAGDVGMPEYPVAPPVGIAPGTVSTAALIKEAGFERDGDDGRLEGLGVTRK